MKTSTGGGCQNSPPPSSVLNRPSTILRNADAQTPRLYKHGSHLMDEANEGRRGKARHQSHTVVVRLLGADTNGLYKEFHLFCACVKKKKSKFVSTLQEAAGSAVTKTWPAASSDACVVWMCVQV